MGTFGQRLKDLRNSRGISQNELSKHIGVSKSSVNMYERDEREPGFETLEAIADFFNVNMDYLLGREPHIINVQVSEGLFTASAKPLVIKFFDALNTSDATQLPENLAKIRVEMDSAFMPADFEHFADTLKAINAVFAQAMASDSEELPTQPHTDAPQDAPAPHEGKDTTLTADVPETLPEDE